MNDSLRLVAVALAAALLAAPYWAQIKTAARRALETGVENAWAITRVAAAGLLIAAAWGKIPLPAMSQPSVTVTVETPSDAMQATVAPIAKALRNAPAGDRMMWAMVWEKVAIVAAGDSINGEVVLRTLAAWLHTQLLPLKSDGGAWARWSRVTTQNSGLPLKASCGTC